MKPIRVLVVDDSVVMRRLIADALASDVSIEVVGTAANGRIALDEVDRLDPDLVTLDIEMPVLDGLETLRELRRRRPRLPVIMFSTLTERGGTATLEALARGASDYVTKPSGTGNLAASLRQVRSELIPRIKALAVPRTPTPGTSPAGGPAASRPAPTRASRSAPTPPGRVDLVVVASSTGGPNALTEVVCALPTGLPVPMIIVQHMPPLFTTLLADRLARVSGLPVREAVDGAPLAPGEVWVAPGDYHVEVTGTAAASRLRLHQGPAENSCRPAADVLLRSAAALHGRHLLAVVLTGMGEDGARGASQVAAEGGRVIVQDQASSVVWGMPGAVVRGGWADEVLALEQIGPAVAREVARHRAATIRSGRQAG